MGCSRPDFKWNDGEVFIGISNFVDSPKGIVPSLVSFELQKQRTDFRRQILTLAGCTFREIFFSVAKREFDALRTPAADYSGGVPTLIESRAKIVGGIEENAGERLRNLELKADFVDMLERIRIFIDHVGPRVTFLKPIDSPFEISDVMMCSRES